MNGYLLFLSLLAILITGLILSQPSRKDPLTGLFSDTNDSQKAHVDYGSQRTLVWLTFISFFIVLLFIYRY